MSPKQRKLLGIRDDDPNYQTSSTPISNNKKAASAHFPPFTLASFAARKVTPTPFQTTPPRHSPRHSPNLSGGNLSYHHSPYLNMSTAGKRRSQSTNYMHETLNESSPTAFDGSMHYESPVSSHGVSHHRFSPFRNQILSPEEQISDHKSLQSYLQNFSDLETSRTQFMSASLDSSYGSNSNGFRNFSRMSTLSPMDTSHELLRNHYQMAVSSPKSPSSRNIDDKEEISKFSAFDYCHKHNVTRDELTTYVARLRAWLSTTLLQEVANEVVKVNKKLHSIGCPEVQIGDSSLSTLKQVESTKCTQIPNLTKLLPYLEVSNNQEYLVQRVKDISKGGYMSEYKWNGGGDYGARKWNNKLPTDSEIIISFLCAYLDSHMPAHPRYPNGKAFSSQFFMKLPDKPVKEDIKTRANSERLLIYQSKVNPPHFQLRSDEDVFNFPQGRGNLLCTLVVFLHIIKTKYSGMLGQVNLGMSGINILWIFEDLE